MTQLGKVAPHYRMYVEDVYRDYADGLLTVKGAVFCAIAATCKFGEPCHFNVSVFLERTGIHPRSYARAVASLIEAKRLDFPPNAIQTLRVPVAKDTREPLHYSLSTNSGQICDREGSICPEDGQICDREGSICPERSQICPEDRPKTPLEAESESPSIYQSNQFLSLSSRERENDVVPDEYEEWLTRKASQLPTPPTLLEEWIEKNRNKKSNRKQFLKYKQALREASVPQPAAPAIFEVKNEQQQRLETLQFWWDDGSQERVQATIAANPSWGLRVGVAGVEVRA